MVVSKTNKEDIKRAETIAMVDKAIDKLTLFKSQIIEESITVEDISINNRLVSRDDEAIGSFNLDIDIDYTVSPNF